MSLLDSVTPNLFETDRRVFALAFARMADSIGNSFLIIVLPLYISSGVITGNTFGLGAALAGLGALLVYSQVQETHPTRSGTPSGAQPAAQD